MFNYVDSATNFSKFGIHENQVCPQVIGFFQGCLICHLVLNVHAPSNTRNNLKEDKGITIFKSMVSNKRITLSSWV